MKTLFAFLVACGLNFSAQAGCYSVYQPGGKLIFQSNEAPVDTRFEYHRTVPARFGPSSTLVYDSNQLGCAEIGLQAGAASGARTAGVQAPGRAMRADRS
ncbi:MAG: hypothetical protein JWR74_2376 [Polaromonas sp.]|jgi:hypothetical protein|nr:hypothetical protein [Polaromonas sp.]